MNEAFKEKLIASPWFLSHQGEDTWSRNDLYTNQEVIDIVDNIGWVNEFGDRYFIYVRAKNRGLGVSYYHCGAATLEAAKQICDKYLTDKGYLLLDNKFGSLL